MLTVAILPTDHPYLYPTYYHLYSHPVHLQRDGLRAGVDDALVLAAGGGGGVEGGGAAVGEVRAVVAEAARDEAGGAAQGRVGQHLAGPLARLQREGLPVRVRGRRECRRRAARAVPVARADHEAVGLHVHVALAR